MTEDFKKELIDDLIRNKCIKLGNFKLKNGDISKYYFDMKNLISNPKLLSHIGDEIYKLLGDFDIICGIPYGGLPIATYISTKYNKPLIYIRDKPKTYGTEKLIEGTYKKNDKCIIIDDVITTGESIQNVVEKLKDVVTIVDIVVVLNRQQTIIDDIPNLSSLKSLLYKNDITQYLLHNISETKKSKLIFSADLTNYSNIISILQKIGKHIVACKIHSDIIDNVEEFIPKLIELSITYNFLIMEDRKFNDISSIVNLQYKKFKNWVDLVTVHVLVSHDVVKYLSGVLIVANMSNNNYNFTEKAIELAKQNKNNVIGFITQKKINCDNMICMTPGISFTKTTCNDQQYKTINDIDTDYYIVGRALYNSKNIMIDIKSFIESC